jgi:hypothetical protein
MSPRFLWLQRNPSTDGVIGTVSGTTLTGCAVCVQDRADPVIAPRADVIVSFCRGC